MGFCSSVGFSRQPCQHACQIHHGENAADGEQDKTFAGQRLATNVALGPVGLTALGARALGVAGEAFLPSILKAATTRGLLNAGDAYWRGGNAQDIAKSALIGIATGPARPILGRVGQKLAPLLAPIFDKSP